MKHQLGLLLRDCTCSSVTACSTRRCSCFKKGDNCSPGCKCNNCANTPNATGTQQQNKESLPELVEKELVHGIR